MGDLDLASSSLKYLLCKNECSDLARTSKLEVTALQPRAFVLDTKGF